MISGTSVKADITWGNTVQNKLAEVDVDLRWWS